MASTKKISKQSRIAAVVKKYEVAKPAKSRSWKVKDEIRATDGVPVRAAEARGIPITASTAVGSSPVAGSKKVWVIAAVAVVSLVLLFAVLFSSGKFVGKAIEAGAEPEVGQMVVFASGSVEVDDTFIIPVKARIRGGRYSVAFSYELNYDSAKVRPTENGCRTALDSVKGRFIDGEYSFVVADIVDCDVPGVVKVTFGGLCKDAACSNKFPLLSEYGSFEFEATGEGDAEFTVSDDAQIIEMVESLDNLITRVGTATITVVAGGEEGGVLPNYWDLNGDGTVRIAAAVGNDDLACAQAVFNHLPVGGLDAVRLVCGGSLAAVRKVDLNCDGEFNVIELGELTNLFVSGEALAIPNCAEEDSDSDELDFVDDNCPDAANPAQADSDGDGVGDACDNCPDAVNTNQADSDGDGIGDACDGAQGESGDCLLEGSGTTLYGVNACSSRLIGSSLQFNPRMYVCEMVYKGVVVVRDISDQYLRFVDGEGELSEGWQDKCTISPEEFVPPPLFTYPNSLEVARSCIDEGMDAFSYYLTDCSAMRDMQPIDEFDYDGDSVENLDDNCPVVANAAQADFNNDQVGDACGDADEDEVLDADDNCPEVANTDQADANNNAIGDVCDNAVVADSDGDGIADADDNCPEVANAEQDDSDDNGVGDACEAVVAVDSDGDGIADADDNCPEVANAEQDDSDDNGVGDACDGDENVITDIDGDGIADEDDNCPAIANPDQADSDEDGIGDECQGDPAIEHESMDGVKIRIEEMFMMEGVYRSYLFAKEDIDVPFTVYTVLEGEDGVVVVLESRTIPGMEEGEYIVLRVDSLGREVTLKRVVAWDSDDPAQWSVHLDSPFVVDYEQALVE